MGDASQRGGLTIESEEFNPVTVCVGGNVWITQRGDDGESLIMLDHEPAQRLADAITLALAKWPAPPVLPIDGSERCAS